MNEDDAVRAALQEYYEDNRPAGYGAAFRAGWEAHKQWAATPIPEPIRGPCWHGDSRSCMCEDGEGSEEEEWGDDSAAQQLERGPR
jgi:hypothetical protein